MKKNVMIAALAALTFLCIGELSAQTSTSKSQAKVETTVTVGGEAMYPKKNIVENAVNSKDHTTLVAAVKAAGLVETLQGKGPFTVFAPVNNAFEDLPEGTVETLLKPENKGTLTTVLTYHVVAGKLDFNAIAAEIKKGNGKATLKTVSGGTLTAMMNGARNIQVKDEAGNIANISTYDVYQSNGVIHVVDKVLLPKM
ncbi:MAG: fasciclin domain-containing protein [Saprospiraceae bacterium]